MRTGRPKPAISLTADEQTQLRSLAASRTLPHALVARARLVLWSVEGQSNGQIAPSALDQRYRGQMAAAVCRVPPGWAV